MSFFRKPAAIEQLITIALLWFCVVILTAVLFAYTGAAANDPFPVKEITRFLDWQQLIILAAASAALFAAFKAVGHRSSTDSRRRSDEYADLALDEIAGALFHFGSLPFVCAAVGASRWYFALTVAMWWVVYKLKPTLTPTSPPPTQAPPQ